MDIDYNVTGAESAVSSNMKVAKSFMAVGRVAKNASSLSGDIKDLAKGMAILKGSEMLISKAYQSVTSGSGLTAIAQYTPTLFRAGVKYIRPLIKIFQKMIPHLMKGGILLGAATAGMMLNEISAKWLEGLVLKATEKIGNVVSNTFGAIGTAIDFYRKKFANVATDAFGTGAYFAPSQMNLAETQKQFTPEEQKRFLENESKRLEREGYQNLVKRMQKEMKEVFKQINDANNAKFDSIVDTMRYQGRL